MADRLASIILKYQVDKSSLTQVERSTGAIYARLEDLRNELTAIEPAGKKAGRGIENSVKSAEKQVNRTRKAVEQLDDALTDVERRKRTTESQGDISTGLGAGASVLGAFGSGGATEALRIGGDVFGLLEYKDRLIAGASELIGSGTKAAATLGSIGLAAAALGVVSVLISQYNAALDQQKRALDIAITAQTRYYELLSEGTSQDAIKRLEEINRANAAANAELQAVAEQLNHAETAANAALGTAGAALAEFVTSLPAEQLRKRYDELSTALITNAQEVELLTQGLGEGAFAAADLAAAEKALTDARLSEIDRDAQIQRRLVSALTGTADASQARVDAINSELAIIEAQRQRYRELGQDTAALDNAFRDLQVEQEGLISQVLPLVRAREDEAQALKDYQAQSTAFGEQYRRELEETAKAEENRLQSIANTQQKANDDIAGLKERGLQQQADLEQEYADTLVSISQKAADESIAALQRLEDAQRSAATDLSRGDADALTSLRNDQQQTQIDFQREEADAYKSHLQDLETIRRNAQDEEFDLVASRDFAGLFRRRRQTTREIEDAQRTFNDQREGRLEAFNRENEDQLRQYENERQGRLTAYQRELADAQAQFNQERQQAAASRQAELAQAQSAYNAERAALQAKLNTDLNARRAAHLQELQLLNQTLATRNAIQAKFDQALLEQSSKTLAAAAKGLGSPGSIAPSSGTPLSISPQSGGFSSPTFSSSVANSSSNVGGITFNVSEAGNPQKTVDMIGKALKQYLGLN